MRGGSFLALIFLLTFCSFSKPNNISFDGLMSLFQESEIKDFPERVQEKLQNTQKQKEKPALIPFPKDKDRKFYNEYLAKYFPKVFVVREQFFYKMSVEKIANALQEIVDIFTYKPWFYVSNDEKKCNVGQYWEYVLDQLAFYSEYIENAKVDKKTKEVFFEEKSLFEFEDFDYEDSFKSLFSDSSDSKDLKPLKTVWEDLGIQAHHDFYALCFDYVGNMFNEGILRKDWSQASWYHYELRKVYDKLVGTKYEAEYDQHVKVRKELYDKLRIILGFDQDDSSDSDSSEDKYWNEFMEFLDI